LHCGAKGPNLKKCGGCKTAYYCSVECQRANWKDGHKLLCKILGKLEAEKGAAPAVKGNTATNATKSVTLENGTEIFVPMFLNEGERIRINTENGEYVERAN
jgi:hypothetical protein